MSNAVACCYLEDGLNKEAFRVAVIAAKRQDLADDAAARLTLDMDDEIDSFSDLGFGIGERGLRVAAHHEIGETMKGFLGRVGVDRSQRTCMARVEGIEQRSRLDSADFAENDPVRSPAESGPSKVVERDLGLERISLAFRRQNVRLLDLKLGGILDDNDAFLSRELSWPVSAIAWSFRSPFRH